MKLFKHTFILAFVLLVGIVLTACQNDSKETNKAAKEENDTKTQLYTDSSGHKVEIPVHPKRVIFHGENVGDLIALDIQPIGGIEEQVKDTLFKDKVTNFESVGFPINLEKTLELKPDLIIFANDDDKTYQQLEKIAPTIVFNTFAPLEERLHELGKIFDKEKAANEWIDTYHKNTEAMWDKLKADGIIKAGETASVFTYYPGDRLFVMAGTGLPQILYDESGFKPVPEIQKILDNEQGFEEISIEKLNDFAGDRIFILNPIDEEAKKSTEALYKNKIWQGLPAVKNDQVYTLDIMQSMSDASTRDIMLEKLPELLTK